MKKSELKQIIKEVLKEDYIKDYDYRYYNDNIKKACDALIGKILELDIDEGLKGQINELVNQVVAVTISEVKGEMEDEFQNQME